AIGPNSPMLSMGHWLRYASNIAPLAIIACRSGVRPDADRARGWRQRAQAEGPPVPFALTMTRRVERGHHHAPMGPNFLEIVSAKGIHSDFLGGEILENLFRPFQPKLRLFL